MEKYSFSTGTFLWLIFSFKFSNNMIIDIIFRCVPGVCSGQPAIHEFEDGFTHPAAAEANFNPNFVSCTNIMPASHTDPQIAGLPALGSKCSIEW